MQIQSSQSTSNAILNIYRLLVVTFVLLALYFAQTIFIPLALAALFTFLLSPLVTRSEKYIGRIAAILFVVIVVFTILGFAGYIFAKQFAQFGSNFQVYYDNIQRKIQALEFPQFGIFNRITHQIQGLKDALIGPESAGSEAQLTPADVKLIDIGSGFADFAKSFFGSFFNMIGMTALVILLVIFMLLNQEDIKSRIIKLAGQSRIGATASALDDASERVYNYLYRLFIVNVGFGVAVATGLHFIGLPNAILWGTLAGILRFIPYIGPWIAAAIPIILSFIVFDSWLMVLITFFFFIVLELFTAYVIEPTYYGEGTGVSAFALILAAIFWTWLWGPIGLLLSTPLTVCLVVLGHYATNMDFLRILLSKEDPLTPAEECYHRLLSFDPNEAMDVVESCLTKESSTSLYDTVLIPVIRQTEEDANQDLINIEKKETVYQTLNEIVEYVGNQDLKDKATDLTPKGKILCVPVRTQRDELGTTLLSQQLMVKAYDVETTKKQSLTTIYEQIDNAKFDVICIVAVAPFALSNIRFLSSRIRERQHDAFIILCLFGSTDESDEFLERFNSAGADKISFTIAQTMKTIGERTSNPQDDTKL